MPFVLDASMALAWLFPDESDPIAEAILPRTSIDQPVVPPLWFLEVTNSLLNAERQGRISAKVRHTIWLQIDRFDLAVAETDTVALREGVTVHALRHNLSAYDAVYLTLAKETGLPLATLDRQLAVAAAREKITLLRTA